MPLLEDLQVQLADSLQRKAATTGSRWGEQYVILGKPLPGPMRLTSHPWSRIWMDIQEDWVGKKAAQMAMTNSALVRALYTIDILRNDVLYVLPKKTPDAADFSKAKFDSILELSPHLKNMFSNVRNIGHKQSGNVNFFLRGSRSRSGLKSISVGLKIFDEFDEMRQANVPLAEERSAGYSEKDTQTIKLSTPTFPEFGISKEYESTTQEHYFFRCPYCSLNGKKRWAELTYPECLVIPTDSADDQVGLKKSHLICPHCRHPLPENKKQWINERDCAWQSTVANGSLRGFWIPQFYSIMKPLWKMAKQAVRARTDTIANQEFHNSVLALEFIADGARVTVEMVENCKGNYVNQTSPSSTGSLVTMGVDVGHKQLYCHIDEWLLPPHLGPNLNSEAVCLSRGILVVSSFHELDSLMYSYQIKHAVVDVDPVFREAIDFANGFKGRVNLCRFVHSVKMKDINSEENSELVLHVNRTIWLDQSQSRYRVGKKSIVIPNNPPTGYEKMISALIRKDERDKDDNIVSKYINTGPDHWAFARVYSEIALPIAVSGLESSNISNFL